MSLTEYTKQIPVCQEKSLVKGSYLKTNLHIQIYQGAIAFVNTNHRYNQGNPNPVKRSKVREFSKASRKRLLRLFSKIDLSLVASPVFLTLTYHYGFKSDPLLCKKHLNAFLQYLRDNFPSLSYIWRLELQKRGAPHYHFMLFSLPGDSILSSPIFERDLRFAWHRIADPSSNAHLRFGFQLIQISSFRMAYSYVSKYCAKESSNELLPGFGRRWGFSRNLPISPLFNFELPSEMYYLVRRIARRFYKKRRKYLKRIESCLKSRCSLFFFIPRDLAFKILNFALDSYLSSDVSIMSKHMLVEHLLSPC